MKKLVTADLFDTTRVRGVRADPPVSESPAGTTGASAKVPGGEWPFSPAEWAFGPAVVEYCKAGFLRLGMPRKDDPVASRNHKADLPVLDVAGWEALVLGGFADGQPRTWARFCCERFDRGPWVLLNHRPAQEALYNLVATGRLYVSQDFLFMRGD